MLPRSWADSSLRLPPPANKALLYFHPGTEPCDVFCKKGMQRWVALDAKHGDFSRLPNERGCIANVCANVYRMELRVLAVEDARDFSEC